MERNVTAGDYVEAGGDRSVSTHHETHASGVAWGAVLGGAFIASAFYLLLLALGAGFGLTAVSPWSNAGASATALGVGAIIWLIGTVVISSALGGYITGRLRTKWALVHTDEVYFRDTANGLLSWAVALVLSVAFLASTAAYMAGGAAQVAASHLPSEGTVAASDPNAYFVDSLFRSEQVVPMNNNTAAQAEAGRIFSNALTKDEIPANDQTYLAKMIAARTGLSQADAERRVADTIGAARQAADTARKVAARLLLYSFLALLMGAFSASYFATYGGKLRDHVETL